MKTFQRIFFFILGASNLAIAINPVSGGPPPIFSWIGFLLCTLVLIFSIWFEDQHV